MPQGTGIPITPEVLEWAIQQSGLSLKEIAEKLKVPEYEIRLWNEGDDAPGITKLKHLAEILNRTVAFFLLPTPPVHNIPDAKFRHPVGERRQHPNDKELRYLRETTRLQSTLSWIRRERGDREIPLGEYSSKQDVEPLSVEIRRAFKVDPDTQLNWHGGTGALKGWRDLFEQFGIYVFLYPMGGQSCRGFSLWDPYAPCIAVNTHWNNEARIFTLLHELGHLLTRSNSICVTPSTQLRITGGDQIERWCEKFAAATLLPWDSVAEILQTKLGWRDGNLITDLDDVGPIARSFKASLRATTLRLIEKHAATWALYDDIPAWSDDKETATGGNGRTRKKLREDWYGKATSATFVAAIKNDLISRADVLTYLNVSDSDLYGLQKELA